MLPLTHRDIDKIMAYLQPRPTATADGKSKEITQHLHPTASAPAHVSDLRCHCLNKALILSHPLPLPLCFSCPSSCRCYESSQTDTALQRHLLQGSERSGSRDSAQGIQHHRHRGRGGGADTLTRSAGDDVRSCRYALPLRVVCLSASTPL